MNTAQSPLFVKFKWKKSAAHAFSAKHCIYITRLPPYIRIHDLYFGGKSAGKTNIITRLCPRLTHLSFRFFFRTVSCFSSFQVQKGGASCVMCFTFMILLCVQNDRTTLLESVTSHLGWGASKKSPAFRRGPGDDPRQAISPQNVFLLFCGSWFGRLVDSKRRRKQPRRSCPMHERPLWKQHNPPR